MGIVRDSSYMVLSNIILVFTSLATGVLTARLLGPEGRGELYLIIQIASLCSLFLSCGLGSSYQYHLSKKIFDHATIISHMLMQLLITSIVVIVLYLYGSEILLFITGSSMSKPTQLLTSIAIILNVVIMFVTYILMSMPEGIKFNSIIGIFASLVNLTALVFFIWFLKLGAYGAILAYILSLLVRFLPIIPKIMSGVWRKLSFTWLQPSPKLFTYSFSAFLSNMMVSSVFRIDVFILSSLAGVAAVGIYSVAVAFAEMALMIPNALGTSLFTHLPSSTPAEQNTIIQRSSRIILFIAFIVGLVLAVISYPLVVILMGKRFIGAVEPLCLLLPGIVAMSINYVYANFYGANGKPLVSAACFAVGLLVNIGLNYVLIPVLKINGAAIASSVSYAVISTIFIFLLRRQHGFTIRDLLLVNREDISLVKDKVVGIVGRLMPGRV
jgi:O-antigen/teichoic acid export membrane protein